jgi:predicted dehydrogenase
MISQNFKLNEGKKDKHVTLAMIGCGSRGLRCYGEIVRNQLPDAKIIAVAEPREHLRKEFSSLHGIAKETAFSHWRELFDKPQLADAVIIATSDKEHFEPTIAAAKCGYDILLEKPMAPTADECIKMVQSVHKNNVMLAVCHVLRYAPFYRKIKELIDSGAVGEICSIQHMEGVGWWHQAHAYVRGIFANQQKSSFMLLAKSCHDIDIINWWVGKKCKSIASFGSLKHFRSENKPQGAGRCCMECKFADDQCPYSAKRYYFDRLRNNDYGWPLNVVISEFDEDSLAEKLHTGPYGRCIYACDNDVVDHQVVMMEFEDGVTADFTMSAFTPHGRKTRIMGTHGYIEGDSHVIRHLKFNNNTWTDYDINALATDITGGHGGGDIGIMRTFIDAVRDKNTALIATNATVTLDSHLMVFAAEKARLENRVVQMSEFENIKL